jgi:hypothetical protein
MAIRRKAKKTAAQTTRAPKPHSQLRVDRIGSFSRKRRRRASSSAGEDGPWSVLEADVPVERDVVQLRVVRVQPRHDRIDRVLRTA